MACLSTCSSWEPSSCHTMAALQGHEDTLTEPEKLGRIHLVIKGMKFSDNSLSRPIQPQRNMASPSHITQSSFPLDKSVTSSKIHKQKSVFLGSVDLLDYINFLPGAQTYAALPGRSEQFSCILGWKGQATVPVRTFSRSSTIQISRQ